MWAIISLCEWSSWLTWVRRGGSCNCTLRWISSVKEKGENDHTQITKPSQGGLCVRENITTLRAFWSFVEISKICGTSPSHCRLCLTTPPLSSSFPDTSVICKLSWGFEWNTSTFVLFSLILNSFKTDSLVWKMLKLSRRILCQHLNCESSFKHALGPKSVYYGYYFWMGC